MTAMNTQCLSPRLRYADPVEPAATQEANVRHMPLGALVSLPHFRPGTVLSVIAGMIWITQEGIAEDFVLHAGESLRLDHRGAVVAESLEAGATLAVSQP
jgi:hypothetical protein